MDARQYLEQVRNLHRTILTLQMRIKEQEYALDLLRTALHDMPTAHTVDNAIEQAIIKQDELKDMYTGELIRWTALRTQAYDMLDRAREVLNDGQAHWIKSVHIDVIEQHYLQRLTYPQVASALHYGLSTVERYAAEALDWLDSTTDVRGYPMVPIVSE